MLLPGEGQGRNAVYAAKLGWQVTAIDLSEAAKQRALEFAKENNVKIEYHVTPLEEFNFPENEFDAAALVFTHFPADSRNKLHSLIIKSLKPGRSSYNRSIQQKTNENSSGGPKDLASLNSIDELTEDFKNLKIWNHSKRR